MSLTSWRDKLDKLIYTYDEEPEAEAPAAVPAPAPAGRRSTVTVPSPVTAAAESTDSASVGEFLSALRQETEDDRSQGHQKFWDQLTALQGVEMAEKTRYQAAAKTAAGVTVSDLLSSITAVEAEVDGEVKVFENFLATREQEEVGDARDQVLTIDTQLGELQKQVAELEGQKSSLVAGISVAERKFVRKRADFAEAVLQYRAELSAERHNIETHLKPKKGA